MESIDYSERYSHELLGAAKAGDREAQGKLIVENSGLIWSVARRFFGRGVDPDDLYQLGCMGFLKAIFGYDENYGTQFSTYAVPKISGEIRRFLRDDGTVKVSRTLKERSRVVRRTRENLALKLGREPRLSELEIETGLSAEEIAICEKATEPPDSLQRESGDGGPALENLIGDALEDTIVESVALREAVNLLSDRERQLVDLRFFRGLTQTSTAKILGVSQVQISRLERKAIQRLREMLEM